MCEVKTQIKMETTLSIYNHLESLINAATFIKYKTILKQGREWMKIRFIIVDPTNKELDYTVTYAFPIKQYLQDFGRLFNHHLYSNLKKEQRNE